MIILRNRLANKISIYHYCFISSAYKFDVTLDFLLQQAAWLCDRQLSKVREQMRKVGHTQSNATSPAPWSASGSAALGGQSQTSMKAVPAPNNIGMHFGFWIYIFS